MPSQRGFVGAMFQGEKGEERRDVVGRGEKRCGRQRNLGMGDILRLNSRGLVM